MCLIQSYVIETSLLHITPMRDKLCLLPHKGPPGSPKAQPVSGEFYHPTQPSPAPLPARGAASTCRNGIKSSCSR